MGNRKYDVEVERRDNIQRRSVEDILKEGDKYRQQRKGQEVLNAFTKVEITPILHDG